MTEPATISFEQVSVRFGNTVALDTVSFEVLAGQKIAVIGANGAGKSTLLRALLGLIFIDAGTVAVNGVSAHSSLEWTQRRMDVAYIPQRPAKGRFPLSVHELLKSSCNPDSAIKIAHDLGLSKLMQQSVPTLSGGQLQRCYVARGIGSLAGGATVLVADEPTSALDFDGQKHVAQLLTEIPATLLVVTHERAVAEKCDRVFEMAGGVLREAGSL